MPLGPVVGRWIPRGGPARGPGTWLLALCGALATFPLDAGAALPSGASTQPAARAPPETAEPPREEATDEKASDEKASDEEDAEAENTRVIHVVNRLGDQLTASARTIDHDTIDTTPKRSAEDLLRLVPGLLIVQHGNQGKGYQFYLRGFDAVHGQDLETLVDDIPINEVSNVHANGYLDLAFIIPEVVSTVDATKGSVRLEQANFATAGSIQYHLGVPWRGTRVGYEIGTTNRHRAVVVHAPRRGPKETFFAAEALYDGGYGQNRKASRLSELSRVRLVNRPRAHLDLTSSLYSARFGMPGTVRLDDVNSGRIGLYDAYSQNTHGESDRAILGLSAGGRNDRVKWGGSAYGIARRFLLDENYTGWLLYHDNSDRHRQEQYTGSFGTRGHVAVQAHPRVELRAVTNYQVDRAQQRQDQLFTTGQTWGVTRNLDYTQQLFGIGTGIRATPVDWFLLDGGVRFDLYHADVTDHLQGDKRFSGTFHAVSPRLAMRFTVSPRWRLFAAYGRGFRSPEARAVTHPRQAPADVELARYTGTKPYMTRSDDAEVGARFRPNDVFDMGLSLFGIWISKESIFDHVSGFNVELSGTQRLGLETDVQLHPAKWLNLGADLTAVRGRFKLTGDPIPGAPSLITSVFGTLVHPSGWRGGLRWFLVGPRPLTYGAKAGVMTVLDVSAGYRHEWFQIDLAIDNILNLKWREGEYNFASWWDRSTTPSQIPTIHYIAGYPRMARLIVTVWF